MQGRRDQPQQDRSNASDAAGDGARDEVLADRLDALTPGMAERVLERAIRIHTDEHGDGSRIDRRRLYDIAAELGVDTHIVDRALREELGSGPGPDRGRRFFAPRSVSGRVVVTGHNEIVATRVSEWMTRDEGLRPAARNGDEIRWAPDTHWKTAAKVAIIGRGTKSLKGLPSVVHRQTDIGSSEHVVEIEADTKRIGTVAGSVGAGLAVAALGGGVASVVVSAGGNDLVQFLIVGIPGLAVAIGTTVTIAKAWTHAIRTGVSRALEGISEPDIVRRPPAGGSTNR